MRYKELLLTEQLTPFLPGGRSILNPGIPTDFPLASLFIMCRGRVACTVAAGVVTPEAPLNLIERIRIFGHHRAYGDQEILNLEGVDLWVHQAHYALCPPLALAGGLAAAVGVYDFEVAYPVEFALPMTNRRGKFYTMLDAPSFDALQLEITWCNLVDFLTAATFTFQAFGGVGGAAGVPGVTIHKRVPLLGADAVKFAPGIVKRTFESVAFNAVGLVDGLISRNVPRGNTLRSIMIKQGTRAAQAGAWATIVNNILTRPRLKVSNNSIRDYDWNALQAITRQRYNMQLGPFPGYGIFEFVEDGNIDDGLITVDYPAKGVELQVTGDVTATANARFNLVYTEIVAR